MIDSNSIGLGNRIAYIRARGRLGLVLEIVVVFLPLLILGAVGEILGDGTALGAVLINLAYLFSVAIATFALKSRGSGWGEIGLARPVSWRRTILLGLGALVGYLLITIVIQAVLVNVLGLAVAPSDRSSFNALYGNLPLLILYVVAAWTFIAFGEEMIFRAYLMNALAQLLDPARAKWALALIISSIFFGLAHFSWGITGIVETALLGLVFGFVYLRSGRNLWVTIIAHGLGNTLGFTLVYLGVG